MNAHAFQLGIISNYKTIFFLNPVFFLPKKKVLNIIFQYPLHILSSIICNIDQSLVFNQRNFCHCETCTFNLNLTALKKKIPSNLLLAPFVRYHHHQNLIKLQARVMKIQASNNQNDPTQQYYHSSEHTYHVQ